MSDNSGDSRELKRRKRSRTGCITCRIRRVKCDETKPHCNKCAQSQRVCDGYAPPSMSGLSRRALAVTIRGLGAVGPAGRALAAGTHHAAPGDVSGFDYFRQRTAPAAGTLFPSSDFWSRLLLQAAHTEPAVWSAAAALGALHRRWEVSKAARGCLPGGAGAVGSEETCAGLAAQAAACYGRALGLARAIGRPAALLVLSVALAAASNLSGRWTDSRVHVSSGQKLLRQIRDEGRTPERSAADDEVSSAADPLARIDIQGITFSEATAPYPYSESGLPEDASVLAMRIESLAHAGMLVFGLLGRLLVLAGRQPGGDADVTPQDRLAEMRIAHDLTAWEEFTLAYCENSGSGELERNEVSLTSLKLYHAMLRLLLKTGISGPESRWDAYLAEFERLVCLSAVLLEKTRSILAPLVFVDMGIVMPMFFTATRCRHPQIRRYAANLLRLADRQEGVWHSIAAAAVAEKVIGVEEEGLGISAPTQTYLPPSEAQQWAREVRQENLRQWLGEGVSWTARATWEGIIRVPGASVTYQWQRMSTPGRLT
ncbi:hypothetical protein NKR23_g5343 [Pleurostoma richardsiae]|uniref:Zn(2)-C6 fungal-type domain-containing protein n=1 Tax=Pleurostoma richardsiae TaxID=41990 RepID=A0AA38S2L5_9PEZI|nr:hypothetical protein NKR23_g5343 [Pleurostoma richardsiae]